MLPVVWIVCLEERSLAVALGATAGFMDARSLTVLAMSAAFCGYAAQPSAAEAKAPLVQLPPAVYAVPGAECCIYFAQLTGVVNPAGCAWEVQCAVGAQQDERWRYVPAEADRGKAHRLVVRMWSDAGVIAAATTTVKVAAAAVKPERRVTAALLGDSLTNCGYQDQAARVVRGAGYANYAPVGCHSGDSASFNLKEGRAPHDGYGGYSWSSFLTRYKMSVDELDGLQDKAEREQLEHLGVKLADGPLWRRALLRSPLLALGKNGRPALDLRNWFKRIDAGRAPDVLLVELGVNDLFGGGDEGRAERTRRVMADAGRLLDEFRKVAPGALIGLVEQSVGNLSQDAFGASYGCQQTSFHFRRNMLAYNRALAELVRARKDPLVETVPAGVAVDPVNGYIRREEPASAGSKRKVSRGVNAVHPDADGGRQFGEAIGAWLADRLAAHPDLGAPPFREAPEKHWKLAELSVTPASRPAPEPDCAYKDLRPLYLMGRGPGGKAREFFAYYGVPKGERPAAGWPGVVLVHGGGGTAFPQFADLWREAGFAVVALDWYNQRAAPGATSGDLDKVPVKRVPLVGGVTVGDHESVVANCILSHSWLLAQEEVDRGRTAMVGLSWGSWYGAAVAAVDSRLKGVVEIYCGDAKPGWSALVNGRFLHAAKTPMWWFVSTNDQNVTPESSAAGWRECANLAGVTIVNDLPHSHVGFRFEGVKRMARAFCGLEPPLPRLGEVSMRRVMRDGVQKLELKAKLLSRGKGVKTFKVGYTESLDPVGWKRPWKYAPAWLAGGDVVGEAPAGTVSCYLAAYEEDEGRYHDLCGTTPYFAP